MGRDVDVDFKTAQRYLEVLPGSCPGPELLPLKESAWFMVLALSDLSTVPARLR